MIVPSGDFVAFSAIAIDVARAPRGIFGWIVSRPIRGRDNLLLMFLSRDLYIEPRAQVKSYKKQDGSILPWVLGGPVCGRRVVT